MSELKHIRTFRSKKLHPEHVKLINEAIRHNARGKDKDVHITYRKENGEVSDRKVRPLAVKGKSLFVAHCHERNAIRSFRVERITMVKQAFWDGFEKRAISAAAWLRAAEHRTGRVQSLLPSNAHGASEHVKQMLGAAGKADSIRGPIQEKYRHLFNQGYGYQLGEIPKELRALDVKKQMKNYKKSPRWEVEEKMMREHDKNPKNFAR